MPAFCRCTVTILGIEMMSLMTKSIIVVAVITPGK